MSFFLSFLFFLFFLFFSFTSNKTSWKAQEGLILAFASLFYMLSFLPLFYGDGWLFAKTGTLSEELNKIFRIGVRKSSVLFHHILKIWMYRFYNWYPSWNTFFLEIQVSTWTLTLSGNEERSIVVEGALRRRKTRERRDSLPWNVIIRVFHFFHTCSSEN